MSHKIPIDQEFLEMADENPILNWLLQRWRMGEIAKFTKHERLLIDREISNLEAMFGGLRGIQKVPDALVVVDPRHESGAVQEAQLLNIPVVAILNTDCDQGPISYAIPANDASVQTISFILGEITESYERNLGTAAPKEAVEAAPVQA
jgi:ribosomal protein S2